MGNNSANCHLYIVTSPYQNFLELFVCSWSGMARGNLSCGTRGHTAPEATQSSEGASDDWSVQLQESV